MASYLSKHPKVRKIYYPGLPDHPGHALAKKQMNGFGALISFDLGSHENAKKFLEPLRKEFPDVEVVPATLVK